MQQQELIQEIEGENLLTPEDITEVIPLKLSIARKQALCDQVNLLGSDPVLRESFRENFMGYAYVMKQGSFKLSDYLNAVKFVSYRLAKNTQVAAWKRTFPDRAELLHKNFAFDPKTHQARLDSYASSYSNTKLVTLIMDQVLIPVHIVNMDLFQESINTLASIMRNEKASYNVRKDSAGKLAEILKPPVKNEHSIEMNITNSAETNEMMDGMYNAMQDMAKMSKAMIENGSMTVDQLRKQDIVVLNEIPEGTK